jgi:MFS superfamily sulfate permease-like transporter
VRRPAALGSAEDTTEAGVLPDTIWRPLTSKSTGSGSDDYAHKRPANTSTTEESYHFMDQDMKIANRTLITQNYRRDFLASIVVFLVALPLCMGIAIASGVPVAAGLITGIIGGLVVGWFAGAPLQVSGPAAGLTVIIFDLVQRYGLEVLGIAVMICGVLQLVAGVLRCGRWFRAVSPAVIHGMLAGIGVLILSSQFHVMVDDAPKGSGIANLMSIPEAIAKGLPVSALGTVEERSTAREFIHEFGALHEEQVQIRELVAEQIPSLRDDERGARATYSPETFSDGTSLLSLAIKQRQVSERLTTLVEQLDFDAVSIGEHNPEELRKATRQAVERMKVAVNDLQHDRFERVGSSQENVQQSLENVLNRLKNHGWAAKVGWLTIIALLIWNTLRSTRLKLIPAPLMAIVVATIAAAVLKLPVLYVEVPDNLWSEIHFPSLTVLTSVPFTAVLQAGVVLAIVASAETLLCATAVDQMQSLTRTNYDKELAAQGIGNMACGLLGALPMTGVIVRSAANVEAGGRSRLATIMHGGWLLVFVSLLAFLLRMIPTSALAAMLVYTGYKLVNLKAIRELKRYGWGEIVIYFATLTTIVCADLLTGVITGILLSAAKLLYTFSHLDVRLDIDQSERTAVLQLHGAATFIRLPLLASELERVPNNVELHVDFDHLNYVDHACLDLLMNWAKQHESIGGTLIIDWESLHADFHSNAFQNLRASRRRVA